MRSVFAILGLVACALLGHVTLLHAAEHEVLSFQTPHTGSLRGMDFTGNSSALTVIRGDQLFLWDTRNWKLTKVEKPHDPSEENPLLKSFRFSPDAKELYTTNYVTLRQWKMPEHELLFESRRDVRCLEVSPNGKVLALSVEEIAQEKTDFVEEVLRFAIVLVDPATGKEIDKITDLGPDVKPAKHIPFRPGQLTTYPVGSQGVTQLIFSPDGKRLFTVAGYYFDVWDVAKRERLARCDLADPSGKGKGGWQPDSFAWSPNGTEICAIGLHDDGTPGVHRRSPLPYYLMRWDAKTGKQTTRKRIEGLGSPSTSVLCPDGKSFFVLGSQIHPISEMHALRTQRIFAIDATSGETVWDGIAADGTEKIAISPDGKWLARHSSSELKVYDVPKLLKVKEPKIDPIKALRRDKE